MLGRNVYWGAYELSFFTKCYHNMIGRACSIHGYEKKCTDVRTKIKNTVFTTQKTICFHIKNRILILSSLRLISTTLLQIFSPYRAVKLYTSVIQTNQLLVHTDILAVCSEIHMKYKYTLWELCKINVIPGGTLCNQQTMFPQTVVDPPPPARQPFFMDRP